MKSKIIPFPAGQSQEKRSALTRTRSPIKQDLSYSQSKKGFKELAGLSPDLLRRIIKGAKREDLSELFTVSSKPFAQEAMTAPMVAILFYLLDLYRKNDNQIPIDRNGFFYRELVIPIVFSMLDPQLLELAGDEEYNIRALLLTHDFLRVRDFVEEDDQTSSLTKEGLQYAHDLSPELAWRDLFDFYRFNMGWLSLNRNFGKVPPDFELIQDSCYFSLYLLKGFESCWISPMELYEGVMKAVPKLKEYHSLPGSDIAEALYRSLFMWMFCEDLGLLEYMENDYNKRLSDEDRVRTTALFRAALDWKM